MKNTEVTECRMGLGRLLPGVSDRMQGPSLFSSYVRCTSRSEMRMHLAVSRHFYKARLSLVLAGFKDPHSL